jgi:hypothetical protein
MKGALMAMLAVALTASQGITEDLEHTVVVGVGGAVEAELAGGTVRGGSNVFVEYKAIEKWLELELGVSVLPEHRGREVPVDFLFKKPIQLTRRLEVMPGLGPEVVWASGTGHDGTFAGVEAVADFMFWPSKHVGLWIEPSYDAVFRDGISHGLGSTGGVIFGW